MNKLIDLRFVIRFFCVFALLSMVFHGASFGQNGQNAFEKDLRTKLDSLRKERFVAPVLSGILLPNGAVQSVMTPSGWGGGNSTYMYVVVGGVFPAEYTDPGKADLITAAGLSFGNSKKYVNVSLSVNIGRVSELQDLSGNFILSKQIFDASSISVGGIQLFASSSISDAPKPTFYIAFSHSVQNRNSEVTEKSSDHAKLGYTIGIGNGRFLNKSPKDVSTGKGKYGTAVFANISYEIFKNININAEWSGLNLGVSSGIRPFRKHPLTIGYGVYNLTRNSGDRISFIATAAYPFLLDKKKQLVK
jgi:hypothetical protein